MAQRTFRLCAALLVAAPLVGVARADRGTPTEGAMDLAREKDTLEQELIAKHGASQRERVHRGLAQVAAQWRRSDGDGAAFSAFVRRHFLVEERDLAATLARFEEELEQIDGHENEIGRALRRPQELDIGPVLAVDPLFAALDPSAHMIEDLFQSKLAFAVLLNFPLTTLEERLREGPSWSRARWAEDRLANRFARRVPAPVQQEITRAGAAADLYIADYNLWMHHVLSEQGERLFPSGMRLISHWNLRDQIKADYADPKGIDRQRVIARLMDRIVTQSIPGAVIDNPRLDWNPFTNQVNPSPPSEIEANAPDRPAKADGSPEPDTRYSLLLANYHAARAADPYSPTAPTAIARSFDLGREIPEERLKAMLVEVLTSPLAPRVAALIEQRLGRKLEPHDLWYAGFQGRAKFTESQLDEITRKRYPTAQSFAADMPRILESLGFSRERAKYLAEHIVVDPSRGAGHALQANRRGDLPHLRTRVEKGGMDYKGYNIAVHELGHNVEQVFSLYDVDHTLLQGVPNNAFTEALAFVFQSRDLEILGLQKPDAESERLRVLNDFWATFEIAGVALVDVTVWHWMYDHPNASPAELRDATVAIARDMWNRYYAPILGHQDTALLGIYSHMISYPLYLSDYPLGHLIAFQIEEHLRHKGPLGAEFERMAKFGAVTPDLWMIHATGAPVGPRPLLKATEAALSGK